MQPIIVTHPITSFRPSGAAIPVGPDGIRSPLSPYLMPVTWNSNGESHHWMQISHGTITRGWPSGTGFCCRRPRWARAVNCTKCNKNYINNHHKQTKNVPIHLLVHLDNLPALSSFVIVFSLSSTQIVTGQQQRQQQASISLSLCCSFLYHFVDIL